MKNTKDNGQQSLLETLCTIFFREEGEKRERKRGDGKETGVRARVSDGLREVWGQGWASNWKRGAPKVR